MNRKQIVKLFTLMALLLSYAPIVGLGGMTATAHGANEAVADYATTSSTDRTDRGRAFLAPTYAGAWWNTFVSADLPQQAGDCPDAMISYWKLDETSGTVFDDYYDGNHAGCSTGHCPGFTTGVVGGALDFNGTSDYLTVGDDPSLDWASDDSFTIELWAQLTNCDTRNKVMIGRDEAGGVHWWLGCNVSTKTANFNLNDTSENGVAVTGNTAINDGKWHHIVVVRDESINENRLYVDGVKDAWATYDYGAGFDATTTLGIGYMAYHGTPDYYYDGLLDEIALYDRALSEREIKTHYYLARGYCDTCDSPVRIMPLGDSITHGTYGHGDPRTDDYVTGYRQPLYLSLTDAGYDVDFVGSLQTGQSATPSFDYDHEGHGGWTDSQVASNVYDWLVDNPADVVLLHIGTNGLDTSSNDVRDILDEIDRYSEDITVVLARIINRISYSQTTTDFNDNVEAMADLRIAAGDRIIIVDMEDGAGLVYTQDTTPPYDDGDMYDNLHPNDDGYAKMADVWLNGDSDGSDGLVDFLPICAPPTPVP